MAHLLLLACLASFVLTACRIAYDVHYVRVLALSIRFPTYTSQDRALSDLILREIGEAGRWGRWRPETPFFEARARIWRGEQEATHNALWRAVRASPNAPWVAKLMRQVYPPGGEPVFRPFVRGW